MWRRRPKLQNGRGATAASILVALPAVAILGSWVLRPSTGEGGARPLPADLGAGDLQARPEGYQDPLRWTFLPSSGVHLANVALPYEREDELCKLKVLVMHQPMHEPRRRAAWEFPFSRYLARRRRLWEIRLQLRFKRLPEGPLYVGIENNGPAPASGVERRMSGMLVGTVRRTVGEMYASPGDDPWSTEGELEPATMAASLAAFDQFAVSEPGEEPDIASDLSEVGMQRADGFSTYIKAMRETIESMSTDKIYTFSFWGGGVSQFVDWMNWQAKVGFGVDFNRFCGQPPLYFAMYEIPRLGFENPSDQRHLLSRKRYYIHVAIWSELRPPEPQLLACLLDGKPSHICLRKPPPI